MNLQSFAWKHQCNNPTLKHLHCPIKISVTGLQEKCCMFWGSWGSFHKTSDSLIINVCVHCCCRFCLNDQIRTKFSPISKCFGRVLIAPQGKKIEADVHKWIYFRTFIFAAKDLECSICRLKIISLNSFVPPISTSIAIAWNTCIGLPAWIKDNANQVYYHLLNYRPAKQSIDTSHCCQITFSFLELLQNAKGLRSPLAQWGPFSEHREI